MELTHTSEMEINLSLLDDDDIKQEAEDEWWDERIKNRKVTT